MDVFYKRHIEWCPYPNQDEKEVDIVIFSTSKKKFQDNSFLFLSPQTPDKERKLKVQEKLIQLEIKFKKINLLKL